MQNPGRDQGKAAGLNQASPAPGHPAVTGRFAPSPTGPLHLGSIVAALGSYLQARHRQGRWLLRIDDLDHSRCRAEYSDEILHCLEALALYWDGSVYYQREHLQEYRSGFDSLASRQLSYPCACSRREVGGGPYPGTCSKGLPSDRVARSERLRCPGGSRVIHDRLQGRFEQDIAAEIGDFILLRADRIWSYHLATVIDDHRMGVTEVVRGIDLLDSTPRQVMLAELLHLKVPEFAHLPLITNAEGDKLSKQNHAPAVDYRQPLKVLRKALHLLGQIQPDPAIDTPEALLQEACRNWDITRLSGISRRLDTGKKKPGD